MPATLNDVYDAARTLTADEREELVDRLLTDCPPVSPSVLHPAWPAELRKRAAQLESGEVTAIPWAEVRRARLALEAQAEAASG